jgi:hypothetical protein
MEPKGKEKRKRKRRIRFKRDPRPESFFQERKEKLAAWFKAGCPLPEKDACQDSTVDI